MLYTVLLLMNAPADPPVQWAQLSIEQRVIIRVPMARRGAPPARPAPKVSDEWREKKGPRCIALRSIRSASIVMDRAIDLLLADNHRYRARLGNGCNSMAFYSGFYVEPDGDGSLCSGRDELQARGGASCPIDSFRRLERVDEGD